MFSSHFRILQNDYPEWWLWCFNSGMEQGVQTDNDRFVNSMYGQCCGEIGIEYDFDLLEEKLSSIGKTLNNSK